MAAGDEAPLDFDAARDEALRFQLGRATQARETRRQALETLTSLRAAPKASRWRHALNVAVGAGYGWLLHFTSPSLPWSLCLVVGVGFFVALGAYAECLALRRRLDAAIALLLEKQSADNREGSLPRAD